MNWTDSIASSSGAEFVSEYWMWFEARVTFS